jgi:hypothetical protein
MTERGRADAPGGIGKEWRPARPASVTRGSTTLVVGTLKKRRGFDGIRMRTLLFQGKVGGNYGWPLL